jgi:hypothetical protein
MSPSSVLANRLHNTAHLASSSYQLARLSILLGRVVAIVEGEDVVEVSSVTVHDMKHTNIRIGLLMNEMHAMEDALKAPLASCPM